MLAWIVELLNSATQAAGNWNVFCDNLNVRDTAVLCSTPLQTLRNYTGGYWVPILQELKHFILILVYTCLLRLISNALRSLLTFPIFLLLSICKVIYVHKLSNCEKVIYTVVKIQTVTWFNRNFLYHIC